MIDRENLRASPELVRGEVEERTGKIKEAPIYRGLREERKGRENAPWGTKRRAPQASSIHQRLETAEREIINQTERKGKGAREAEVRAGNSSGEVRKGKKS